MFLNKIQIYAMRKYVVLKHPEVSSQGSLCLCRINECLLIYTNIDLACLTEVLISPIL